MIFLMAYSFKKQFLKGKMDIMICLKNFDFRTYKKDLNELLNGVLTND